MSYAGRLGTLALLLALPFLAVACPGQAPAPAATQPPAPPTPTTRPAVATPQPSPSPSPVALATPVGTPTPAAAGPSPSELAARARGLTEYSFDIVTTVAGRTITGKSFVKGTKVRQELALPGASTITLLDTATQIAYSIVPDRNIALKIDFSQAMAQAERPAEQIGALPSDARFVGIETIDGKPAAIYEVPSTNSKFWIWIERGLPLRIEVNPAQGSPAVMEFSNYQFGPQPDSLFQLPPDVQVIDTPGKIPGVPTPGR